MRESKPGLRISLQFRADEFGHCSRPQKSGARVHGATGTIRIDGVLKHRAIERCRDHQVRDATARSLPMWLSLNTDSEPPSGGKFDLVAIVVVFSKIYGQSKCVSRSVG
jgi:hypothetical protein